MKPNNNKRKNGFFVGDLVFWFKERDGIEIPFFGTIIYRYCEEDKMKSFLKKHKTIVYDEDSEELKEFYVNEIMEIGDVTQKVWKLNDKYLLLVYYGKSAKA